jgi:hypothetical protein
MLNFLHCKNDVSGAHIDVFVSRRFVCNLMTIWWTFFDKDWERVKTINKFLTSTNVARWGNHGPLSLTLLTLLLKLLNKAWCNLLLMNSEALAVTCSALLYVRWVICTCTSAVGADNLTIVSYFVLFAGVNFLQSQPYLQIDWGSNLFLLLASTCQNLRI